MRIKNHTGLTPCNRKGMLSSIGAGHYWYNTEDNSTHIKKLARLRLQLVGEWVLVWNGDDLLMSCKMGIWDVKSMLVSKECVVSTLTFGREV